MKEDSKPGASGKHSLRGAALRSLVNADVTIGHARRLYFTGRVAQRYVDAEAIVRAVLIALATKDGQFLGGIARLANKYLASFGDDVISLDGRRVSQAEWRTSLRNSTALPVNMIAIGGSVDATRESEATAIVARLVHVLGDRTEFSREDLARSLAEWFVLALEGSSALRRDVEARANLRLSPIDAAGRDQQVARVVEVFGRLVWTRINDQPEDFAQALVRHGLAALGYPKRAADSIFEASAVKMKRFAKRQRPDS